MQTTYKEQIEAIQIEMEQRLKYLTKAQISHSHDKQWLALNDAASTIAAVKFQEQTKVNS